MRALRLALWPAGFVLGVFSLALSRGDPAFSFAGGSLGGAIALLGAGWALLACALLFWGRRPVNAFGPILASAACAWFLAEWDNPGAGSAAVFTIGLVLFAASTPLVGWAMLAYPTGSVARWSGRAAVAIALGGAVIVLGLVPTLVYDPAAQGCAQCPANLLLIADDPGLYDDVNRLGIRLGLVWALVLIAVAGWGLARSSPARRRVVVPVVLAGSAHLAFVAATFAASLDRGFVGSGALERRLWLGQAAALVALALAVGWGLVQARRTRAAVARIVVELAEPAAAGSLRDALARTLDDPRLELAYPVGEGRYVDASGHQVNLAVSGGRSATPLVRDGRPVAVLVHRAGLLDTPALLEEVTSTAHLALENERLQAEARAQLEDLRASRARIVEAADEERRRLERDLHDGAQQRLVGLSLALRLLRGRVDPRTELVARLDEADTELQRAVTELRELAHGIHPAALSDEGLAVALEALVERASTPLRVGDMPRERFPPSVETAAYILVAETAKAGAVSVGACRHDGVLVVEAVAETAPEGLVELDDRFGALDGTLLVEGRPDGGVRIRAEIPCG